MIKAVLLSGLCYLDLLLAQAGTSWLMLAVLATHAQAPVITGVVPAANAQIVSPTSPITVTFNQPLTAGSAVALQVFSTQRGGRRTSSSPATVSNSTLTFAPGAAPYLPGETVRYAVTTTAASTTGTLARSRSGQLTTAVGGTGRGTFQGSADVALAGYTNSVLTADLDADGDLDMVAFSAPVTYAQPGTVSIRFNNGRGVFNGGQDITSGASGNNYHCIAAGDVDGDGDLDLTVPGSMSGVVNVYLNNSRGVFAPGQSVMLTAAQPLTTALGDMDGDGDLDLLVTTYLMVSQIPAVVVFQNNGAGNFSNGQPVAVSEIPYDVAVGDVNGDGALDLVTANGNTNQVSVRLNAGNGTFGGGPDVLLNENPRSVTLSDLDGDGDLDLLTANNGSGQNSSGNGSTATVRLNDGNGNFGASQILVVGQAPAYATAGDLDRDGDQDVLVASLYANTVSIFLNDGAGTFPTIRTMQTGNFPGCLALGDLDLDGDLDLLTANVTSSLVSVQLNGGTSLGTTTASLATAGSLYPNPAHDAVKLLGAAPNVGVTVLDATGRLVLASRTTTTGEASLPLPTTLAPGLYLVRCGSQALRLTVE